MGKALAPVEDGSMPVGNFIAPVGKLRRKNGIQKRQNGRFTGAVFTYEKVYVCKPEDRFCESAKIIQVDMDCWVHINCMFVQISKTHCRGGIQEIPVAFRQATVFSSEGPCA